MVIKNKSSGDREYLKVINTSKMDESIVKAIIRKMDMINLSNFDNLMKYNKIILCGNDFYRLMPCYEVNMSEINSIKYFAERIFKSANIIIYIV